MESPKLIVILLIVLGAMWIPAQGASIERRYLINLRKVLDCTKTKFNIRHFLHYGCFCRSGGNGNQPVDAIDRCCQVHDDCYNEAMKMGCFAKIRPYPSTCNNGVPKCNNDFITKQKCSKKVCDCDVAAAICFKKNENNFNQKFVDYDQKQCKPSDNSS
ncbi:basic phospholipase A2-like isoform X1 [Mustelus asterias]